MCANKSKAIVTKKNKILVFIFIKKGRKGNRYVLGFHEHDEISATNKGLMKEGEAYVAPGSGACTSGCHVEGFGAGPVLDVKEHMGKEALSQELQRLAGQQSAFMTSLL